MHSNYNRYDSMKDTGKNSSLESVIASYRNGDLDAALGNIRNFARSDHSWQVQLQCARVARDICDDEINLPTLRVAFLAGSTVDHLVDLLRYWLLVDGLRLEVYVAPFDSWRQEIVDKSSGLYSFKPDVVWLFLTARDLKIDCIEICQGADPLTWVNQKVGEVAGLVQHLRLNCSSLIVLNNAEPTSVRVFGNLEASLPSSRAFLTRSYNLNLARAIPEGAVIFDLDFCATRLGLEKWEDPRLWLHSKHPFSFAAHCVVAFAASKLLTSFRGRSKKCLVVDLDNTLWGGVIGDDGPEGVRYGADAGAVGQAFEALQIFLKALSLRGIILAVCSKNDAKIAIEGFTQRPDMALCLDDFAAFYANWENKADNIRKIAAELNLGLDSMVFVDDNPAERALVRAEIPELVVPELPADPVHYINFIASGNWFESILFSDEDRNRSKAYRANASRNRAQSRATNIDSYLSELEMCATWGAAEPAKLPRITQLLNKTNQFNLTTKRYSQTELSSLMLDNNTWIGWFQLADRFGDHGLISVIILKFSPDVVSIDTWVMSCRVFSRSMEEFIFLRVLELAMNRGCKVLKGEYHPTKKNVVVADLYKRLGGRLDKDSASKQSWFFDLSQETQAIKTFVQTAVRAAR